MLTIPSVHPYLMTLLLEDPSEREQLTALTHDSWTTIIEEAIAQRLAALLFRRLNHSNDQHLVPSHLLQLLTQQMVQQTAWNLLLTNELEHILTACQTRGITCIPIRGPVFAAQLYGDCSMRQMDDLDLLVHREDLSAIRDMFDQFGYLRHEQQPGFLEAFSYSLEFIHPQHGLIVEPHWTLAYPPFVAATDMAPVWARTVKQQWMNRETWALGQEDLLLHLCLHLLHKGEHAPLLWYYELDRLIRQQHSRLRLEHLRASRSGDRPGRSHRRCTGDRDVSLSFHHPRLNHAPSSLSFTALSLDSPSPDPRSYAGSTITIRTRGIYTPLFVTRFSTKNPLHLCAPFSIRSIHDPALRIIKPHGSYPLVYRSGLAPLLARM